MQCDYSGEKRIPSCSLTWRSERSFVSLLRFECGLCMGPDWLRGKANSCPCALFIHHWPFCVTVLCVLLNEWKRNKLISIAQSHLITFRPKAVFYLTPQTKSSIKAEAVFHFNGSHRRSLCCHKAAWCNLAFGTETVGKGSGPEKQKSCFLLCAALHNWMQQGYNGGQEIMEDVDVLGCACLCLIYSKTSMCRWLWIFNGHIFFFCLASSPT